VFQVLRVARFQCVGGGSQRTLTTGHEKRNVIHANEVTQDSPAPLKEKRETRVPRPPKETSTIAHPMGFHLAEEEWEVGGTVS